MKRAKALRSERIALLFGVAAALSAAPAVAQRVPAPAILRYDFDVVLQRDSDAIAVTETITLSPRAKGRTTLALDLCGKSAEVPTDPKASDPCRRAASPHGPRVEGSVVAEPGMTVSSVTLAGRPAAFRQTSNSLSIDLTGLAGSTAPAKLVLEYRGTPRAGLYIGKSKYGARYFAAVPWPDLNRHWLALVDDITSKTPVSMAVTAPAEMQVVANGALRQQIDLPNAMRRTIWAEERPIPVWQFSLIASTYAIDQLGDYRGAALSVWSLPEEQATASAAFRRMTLPMLAFFSERVGPYPYAKLAQVQAPMTGGGLELASNIAYGFQGAPDPAVVAHEIAHQWFGNAVTEANWDEVWLSEGFATYFALLYAEHAEGRDAFLAGLRKSAAAARKFAAEHPGSTIVHTNLTNVSLVIANQPQVYQGGAQVLHMLRGLVGDETFWRAIRLYYARYRDGHATTADFQRAVEDACTEATDCRLEARRLGWFFDQWLRRGDLPILEGSWTYDRAAKLVRLSLAQKQVGAPFRLPIEVGLPGTDGAPPTSVREFMDGRMITLALPAEHEPEQVLFDPRAVLTMVEADLHRAAAR